MVPAAKEQQADADMDIRRQQSRSILSPVSGFLREAGFTHSLTPARNCTFGCTYCYVPTMRVQGGLRPEDWQQWGRFTTFKENAAELLRKELRPDMAIYCSPLTDPYQPAEAEGVIMPGILRAVAERPPRVFVVQTRGPMVLRDIELVREAGARVSFSLTTDDDAVRRRFEPHCASVEERLRTMRTLRDGGVAVYATLAPVLPCDPERLVAMAASVTEHDFAGDPLHMRFTKPRGATTRPGALRILEVGGEAEWVRPEQEAALLAKIEEAARARGRVFATGPAGFALLAR